MAAGAAILWLSVPHLGSIIKRRVDPLRAADIDDIVALVVTVGGVFGVGRSIVGRHSATSDVYTPNWMPGRNREDCLEGNFSNPETPDVRGF